MWPARSRPWAAAIVLVSIVILGVLIAQATHDVLLGVAAPVFVAASLSSFLAKTEYRLTEEAIEVRTIGVVRSRPWSEMRRATADRTGVFLSPFEGRSWLEAYRGLRLLYGGNRDQVLAFVAARLGKPIAGGAADPEAPPESQGRGRRESGSDARG